MRRTATEIIIDLESRIARLEGKTSKVSLVSHFDKAFEAWERGDVKEAKSHCTDGTSDSRMLLRFFHDALKSVKKKTTDDRFGPISTKEDDQFLIGFFEATRQDMSDPNKADFLRDNKEDMRGLVVRAESNLKSATKTLNSLNGRLQEIR